LTKFPSQIDLSDTLHGLEDIELVIWTEFILKSKDWIENRIPTLNRLRPIDYMKNYDLRSCLL